MAKNKKGTSASTAKGKEDAFKSSAQIAAARGAAKLNAFKAERKGA